MPFCDILIINFHYLCIARNSDTVSRIDLLILIKITTR
ncbi:hypothetical protein Barb6_03494 [Bacteroidales bacterium Barb6]|nr:hypothetical protein Barb6_03494 [Bacteroidales bacterium Barb6]